MPCREHVLCHWAPLKILIRIHRLVSLDVIFCVSIFFFEFSKLSTSRIKHCTLSPMSLDVHKTLNPPHSEDFETQSTVKNLQFGSWMNPTILRPKGRFLKMNSKKPRSFPYFGTRDDMSVFSSTCEVNSRTSRTFPAVYLGSECCNLGKVDRSC